LEHTAIQVRRTSKAPFLHLRLGIRDKILLGFLVVVLLIGAVTGLFMLRALEFNRQYAAMLSSTTTANQLRGDFRTDFDMAVWNIVAGKTAFTESNQDALITELETTISQLMAATDSHRGRVKLDVILRTSETLRSQVAELGAQIAAGALVVETEETLADIRGITALVQDLLNDYMIFEVDRMGEKGQAIERDFVLWAVLIVILLVIVIVFSIRSALGISAGIYLPIKRLHDAASRITQQDVATLVNDPNADELTELDVSFNLMVRQIRDLLDSKVYEQERLKKAEFKVLQAQINPHFLYNTLDTIIWKAEAGQKDEVIALVQALSRFFRITLSKGQDWIPVADEVEHACSYLAIQQMRYRDIMRYNVTIDAAIADAKTLKLTLQPLVENALYHGIKSKRGGGTITVRGSAPDSGHILFEVADDGAGMPAERLAQVRAALDGGEMLSDSEGGVGLRNVHERLRLYYGSAYGLQIHSRPDVGTTVRVIIPRTQA
jgi:two-component system sensor histidine kinase YesM